MPSIFLTSILAHLLLVSSQPPSPAPPAASDRKPLTLSGCVAGDAAAPTQFTLFDPHRGMMYRLTGPRLGVYIGKRVQVVGGLLPTTNIAAQAGSIDETITASATMMTNLAGTTPFNRPKVHVEKIRSLPGGCPAP
jgi:hypothetical protein